ncbi:MAG: YHYH protein [Verrucomicrobiae bacterium]|nr:YHYH protein [Verrucomicrobiae bacterium]
MEIYRDGDYVVIESSNLPDHPSPYFSIDNSQYEAYNGSNGSYRKNPNSIEEQAFVYRIPVNPREAANKSNTNLGSIGISVNGVAFFNQYAGPNNQPLTFEVNSFDQYNGHPQNTGVYHYHFEPIYLSSKYGKGAFLGVLLDGFPVYGPEENGVTLTSANLDDYHGHFGPTPEYPEGIYHYHFTEDGPYLNGGQFFGTPGTQTN